MIKSLKKLAKNKKFKINCSLLALLYLTWSVVFKFIELHEERNFDL